MTGHPPDGDPASTPVPGPGERLARAGLSRLVRPDDQVLAGQIRHDGPVAVWERLRHDHPGIDPERDLERIGRAGGRLVCPGDDEWPPTLADLDRLPGGRADGEAAAPLALWVRGAVALRAVCEQAVAIVGARAASSYGTHVAADLAASLAGQDWTVVSGAAFGVDAAAHRGALVSGGVTVAVVAGGADVAYPRAHGPLLDRIAATGLIVSESPPGCPPYRRSFLLRNRLIAALSRGTVLVEAGLRSGTLNTARHTRRLGRPLMVVPGPVTSAASAGCHRLLREHPRRTVLVTTTHEVIGELENTRPPAAGS
jgi:DNA processing protein